MLADARSSRESSAAGPRVYARAVLGLLIATLLSACASAPPPRLPPPRSLTPVVSTPVPDDMARPTPCPAAVVTPTSGRQAEVVRTLFDAFFLAHAAGRIDPNLVDAQGGEVPQQPLATELICPALVQIEESLPRGGLRVSLDLRAGADVVQSRVRLSAEGQRYRIEAQSVDEIRQDVQILGLRRFLREHPEVDRFQVIDVPFGNDFPAPGGLSPRRVYRRDDNRRLAFVRTPAASTMCLLTARPDSTSTRSVCWNVTGSIDRVIVTGEPIVVDNLVQLRAVLVPPPPGRRASVVDLRLPVTERRAVGSIEARPASSGPAWMGRPLGGAVLGVAPRARLGRWESLPHAAEAPDWLGVASSVPWLRSEPVDAPAELSAIAVTADVDERRRWLAVRSHGAWAISDPIEPGGPDDARRMTSWDAVETGARLLAEPGTLVAWSSDFHASGETGGGAAHLVVLGVDRDRLRERGRLAVGTLRVWRSDLAPVDPVAERRRGAPPGPLHWVAWRLLHAVAPVGAPGCVRVTRQRADVAHVTYDFQALPARPLVPFEPASLPASLRFGPLADPRGDHALTAEGFSAGPCPAAQ